MPAGKGKKGGRRGHELRVAFSGKIRISGPHEGDARFALQAKLTGALRSACPHYFGRTRLPERYAAQIARQVKFVRARRSKIEIEELTVDYQNRHAWKNWLRIESDVDESEPGKAYDDDDDE